MPKPTPYLSPDVQPATVVLPGSKTKLICGVVLFLWIVPGLIGHGLWKADEPYSFGLVFHILNTGDWVVPSLAGEPFMEKPPLFYLTAAATAKLFSPLLPLHDGARLASGLYIALALFFAGLTAEELLGRGHRWLTALLIAGCPGILENGHKLITDTALLSGFAMAFYGLALSKRRHLAGGFWLGTGVGIGFMAKGMIAPGLIGPIALLLPLFGKEWRNRNYGYSLLTAFAACLPWFVIWPFALYQRRPDLFHEWFWAHNVGRYLGHNQLGPKNERLFYLKTVPWFALPAFPLAAYAVWRGFRRKNLTPLILPLCSFVIMYTILTQASDARSLYALPLLLPLAVLATAGIADLPLTFARRAGTVSTIFFGSIAALLWCGWFVHLTGYPAALAGKLHEVFIVAPHFSLLHFGCALLYTLGWLWLSVRRPAFTGGSRFAFAWTAGLTLVFGIAMTIWLPAFDGITSYRSVLVALRDEIPVGTSRVASMGLGESERAMVEYYAGIVTERVEVKPDSTANLLLFQTGNKKLGQTPGPGWQKFWEGNRLGNHKEAFSLWKRME